MSLELSELTGYFRRLLMLIYRKSELAQSIGELEARRTVSVLLRAHLLDQHWGSGHESALSLENEVKRLDEELAPLRSELTTVNHMIQQIVDEMKSRGYDITV